MVSIKFWKLIDDIKPKCFWKKIGFCDISNNKFNDIIHWCHGNLDKRNFSIDFKNVNSSNPLDLKYHIDVLFRYEMNFTIFSLIFG